MPGSTRSYEMAKRLVQLGHTVNLVTSRRESGTDIRWEVTNESGITVHWICIPYSNKMEFFQRLYAFLMFTFYAGIRAATITSSDIVFATSTPLTIAFPAIYAKWKLSIPMVLEVRDLWPEVPIAMGVLKNPILKSIAKFIEKFAYKKATTIVALSPDMRDGIVKNGYPYDKVVVIPNGSDLELYSPSLRDRFQFRDKHGIPKESTLMVYAGTLGKVNGTGYLVHLANQLLDDSRFYILIIGDGSEYDEVYSLAKNSRCLGKNLQILKPVPKMHMKQVFVAADIVVSTIIPIKALEANSANKVFDGMAAGCCIAINHGGWLSKVLQDSDAGVVLSANVHESAEKIRALINSPDMLIRMKKNAFALAQKTFSRDILASQLMEVLENAIKKKRY